MTAKEKANELQQKFYPLTMDWAINQKGAECAKQCAIIAVDEIINTLNDDIRDIDVRGNILLNLIDYWREVKQEIEAL